jgi:hypothetical protein
MSPSPFRLLPHTPADKDLVILGPARTSDLHLRIDHDDVDLRAVEAAAKRVVAILNAHWLEDDEAAPWMVTVLVDRARPRISHVVDHPEYLKVGDTVRVMRTGARAVVRRIFRRTVWVRPALAVHRGDVLVIGV